MEASRDMENSGPFEARYLAFLETIAQLRPRLHRYCARMTGSALDGEDVVQDTLFEAYRKLEQYDASRPLAPWLFGIAHNRCIDFLRRRGVRVEAETAAVGPDSVMPEEVPVLGVGRAVEHLVMALPPKERACVLLKDVFDYTLEEIAELVSSTAGGVKAALNRGRTKLAATTASAAERRTADPELSRLLRLYVDGFNKRDWDGLRRLISADAQLMVADRFSGSICESPYFGRYEREKTPWRMALAEVDGSLAVIALREHAGEWKPDTVVRIDIVNHHIARIVDYAHCRWVLAGAASVVLAQPA
jgi:RNA polymerase sigma-70 factor, ECF subfamily